MKDSVVIFYRQLAFLIILILICTGINCQVVINEFSASNASGIENPENGDNPDWIELFNAGTTNQNLKGYYLSDNYEKLDKWRIVVDTIIPAGGYLLIWADDMGIGLHANYKLSALGEEIVLSSPGLILLDSVRFNEQLTDVSYGRKSDGSTIWGYFTDPTPNAANETEFYSDFASNVPEFSIWGGMYNSNHLVELSTTLGGNIRYTTNGSEPDLNSVLYSEPILVSSTTVLRSRIFKPGMIPGPTVTHTYFMNENSVSGMLPVISLSTDPDNFWDAQNGIYVQNFKPLWDVPINIELFENNGSDRAAFNERARTKINGLYSWKLPQKMLGVYFEKEYGTGNLVYPVTHQRKRSSYKSFALRASGSDWSYTLFRDVLGHHATLLNMNLDIMGFRPAVVYVNGAYMGIHNIREKVDDDYIEKSYGMESGSFDLVENEVLAEAGDLIAYREFQRLLQAGLYNENNYNEVANVMDIENFTDYVITEMATGNTSIEHNVMAWKPKGYGKWRWVVMDLDRGFFNPATNLINFYYYKDVFPFKELMQNQGYRDYFARRLSAQLYTSFHPEQMKKLIVEHKKAIESEMPRHIERWLGTTSSYGNAMPSVEYWNKQVDDLNSYVEERPIALLNDLKQFDYSGTANLSIACSPPEAGIITIENLKLPESVWSGPYLMDISIHLEAQNKPGYEFVGWSSALQQTSDTEPTNLVTENTDYYVTLTGDLYLTAAFNKTSNCILPEIISSDLVLDKSCSPYIASGDVTILKEATLIIQPGVEVWMPQNASISIEGRLLAEGTEEEGITIMSNPEFNSPWGILSFQNTDSISRLKYLTLENASSGIDPVIETAAISSFKADLILDHLTIENIHGNPVSARYSNITVTNSSLHSRITGDLINVKYGTARIENCLFIGNDQPDTDAIDYDEIDNGLIRNCTIKNFMGLNSDAIDIGERATNILIDSVLIYNITDKGISVGQQSTAIVQNSIFINCNRGVVSKDSSRIKIDHCVFYNNVDGIACFEKNLGLAGGNAVATNCIISNYSNSAGLVDSKSTLKISHSLSDNLIFPIDPTNITGNPYFEQPSYFNFQLQPQSPAKGAAIASGNPTDMGVFIPIKDLDPMIMIYQIFVNPEELNLPEFITLYNPSEKRVDLSGYKITKGITFNFPAGTTLGGKDYLYITNDANPSQWEQLPKHLIRWESGKLSNNGEAIQLEESHGIVVDYLNYENDGAWPPELFSGTTCIQLQSPDLDNHFPESWKPGTSEILISVPSHKEIILLVYPNPTVGVVNIQLHDYTTRKVEVINLLGKVIQQSELDIDGFCQLDISGLDHGIFFIRVGESVEKVILME